MLSGTANASFGRLVYSGDMTAVNVHFLLMRHSEKVFHITGKKICLHKENHKVLYLLVTH